MGALDGIIERGGGVRVWCGRRPWRRDLTRVAPLLALLALAGCQELGPDEDEARDVAAAYLRAAGARDWAGVCATRSRLDRHRIDQRFGSCEEGYRKILGASADQLRDARTGQVAVKGEIAAIVVLDADGRRITALTAIIDQGHWRLETFGGG